MKTGTKAVFMVAPATFQCRMCKQWYRYRDLHHRRPCRHLAVVTSSRLVSSLPRDYILSKMSVPHCSLLFVVVRCLCHCCYFDLIFYRAYGTRHARIKNCPHIPHFALCDHKETKALHQNLALKLPGFVLYMSVIFRVF